MASSELRKLVEKQHPPKKDKDSDDEASFKNTSSTPPKRTLLDFARENAEDPDIFLLGRRESPTKGPEGQSPMRLTDLLGKSSKKLKTEVKSSAKLSPSRKPREGRSSRALMVLPEPTYHLRFISSKRVNSPFGNAYIPCLPPNLTQNAN
jgi:hypothetical protein